MIQLTSFVGTDHTHGMSELYAKTNKRLNKYYEVSLVTFTTFSSIDNSEEVGYYIAVI